MADNKQANRQAKNMLKDVKDAWFLLNVGNW